MPHSYSYGGGELNSDLQQRQNYYSGLDGGGGSGGGSPISNSTIQYDSGAVDNLSNNNLNNGGDQDKDGVIYFLQYI